MKQELLRRIAAKDPRYKKLLSPPPLSRSIPLDCTFLGSQVGVSQWNHCNHVDAPLGPTVCKCNGCGPTCPEYSDGVKPMNPALVTWEYGLTTVPSRRLDLLPRTLASLEAGGFPKPRLFIDGGDDPVSWEKEFGCAATTRYPAVKTHANWVLSAYELYLRNPHADRYAMFQDDFVTYKNLRGYLEAISYPEDGYLNLYTFPENHGLLNGRKGFHQSNQLGKGAVALVFSRLALQKVLASEHMVVRATNKELNSVGNPRGQISVDGGIVTAMSKAGMFEYVHNPSLVQHTGLVSSMMNRQHPLSPSFLGEDFDALTLLG